MTICIISVEFRTSDDAHEARATSVCFEIDKQCVCDCISASRALSVVDATRSVGVEKRECETHEGGAGDRN